MNKWTILTVVMFLVVLFCSGSLFSYSVDWSNGKMPFFLVPLNMFWTALAIFGLTKANSKRKQAKKA